ncbi:hypothetical protein BJ165DRAFT_575628 [Panaeolus papilionaceus]|nr:hypothetical protein BJ165DRAFT_575628 [Panaeolus papilionaceus]
MSTLILGELALQCMEAYVACTVSCTPASLTTTMASGAPLAIYQCICPTIQTVAGCVAGNQPTLSQCKVDTVQNAIAKSCKEQGVPFPMQTLIVTPATSTPLASSTSPIPPVNTTPLQPTTTTRLNALPPPISVPPSSNHSPLPQAAIMIVSTNDSNNNSTFSETPTKSATVLTNGHPAARGSSSVMSTNPTSSYISLSKGGSHQGGINAGAISGAVVGVLMVLFLVFVLLCIRC